MLSVECGVAQLEKKDRDQNALSEFSNKGLSQGVPRYQFVDNWLMFKYKQQVSTLSMY